MKITLLQRDICWGNSALNIQRADEAIAALPYADIYILPEMFSTGFCASPEGVAESVDGEVLRWMKRTAAAKDSAVAGSVAVVDDGCYYNRFYFVYPDGHVEQYDKRHLFTYGGEHERFTAGGKRVVVCFRGVRILLQVCYDLRFPVWSRNCKDYDMILYVASWPASRGRVWDALLVARAIENQCYVAGVNRVGTDPSCEYSGGSVVIDPYGRTVAACRDGVEDAVSADVDMAALETFRQKFPVLNDGDLFEMQIIKS